MIFRRFSGIFGKFSAKSYTLECYQVWRASVSRVALIRFYLDVQRTQGYQDKFYVEELEQVELLVTKLIKTCQINKTLGDFYGEVDDEHQLLKLNADVRGLGKRADFLGGNDSNEY